MAEKETEEKVIEKLEPVSYAGSPSGNFLVTEHLERMPSIFSRGLLYLIVLILFISLVYAIVSKIDIVVEARSVIQPESHKIKIISDRDGYIEKIFISEGQAVEEKAPLFLIRSREMLTYRSKADELKTSIPLKREYYDTKISSLRDELRNLEDEHNKTLTVKKLKIDQNSLSLNSTESDIAFWQKEIENLSKEFEDTKALFEKRLTSIGEYNSIKSRLDRARTELEKLFSQKNINQKENRILEEETEQAISGYTGRKKMLGKEIRNNELEKATSLRSMQSELEKNENMLSIKDGSPSQAGSEENRGNLIRAEDAGTVSELYFRNAGEYIRMSDLLCTIVPAGAGFYMDILVANKDIGFIEPGTEIKYKIDAFPYTDYGLLKGKVVAVSPSAVEDKTQGFVYHVRGSLDQTFFEIRGKRYYIKPGMTATAELVTEKKSIFSILVRKLKE